MSIGEKPRTGKRESADAGLPNREIERHLGGLPCKFVALKSVTSTNDEAKRLIASGRRAGGVPYGTVIIAGEQTAGRGRMGRSFASPATGSVYVSFILKPVGADTGFTLVTAMAAVAVCEALEAVVGGEPRIKWVNDIYMGGRKVCGILAESVSGPDDGPDGVVLGIGVNINVPPEAFPAEIRETAGSVRMNPEERARFTAELIRRVFGRYGDLERGESPIQDYRERSFIIGAEIAVVKPDRLEVPAVAEGIADDGSLLVRYADGSRALLRSGEISLKLR